ncbi:hypothetical protein BN14_10073 [Rhizoctonia solani AG-1 IB]|uniref:Uncharacterized protein n=1 Tax=Thanatephorus cucumeris (strain AG1-IB / isolate 7/3/14) TaxID=1108050 RepID=M5C952_THACB|nr:hypothetical protein BN14_10073 [Rhizoctonia solani AG-1 IB]
MLLRLPERQDELEQLRHQLARGKEEIEALQLKHEAEMKVIQKAREEDRLNHETGRKSLCNTIRERDEEVSNLRSSKESELKNLEASKKEEISRLATEKNSKIEELEGKLQAKNNELIEMKIESERKIQDLVKAVQEKKETIEHKTNGTATKSSSKQESNIYRLKNDLHRINAEYSSLRAHTQLQEKTEQADITLALDDINRFIEEFGENLSEHLERYVQEHPPEKVPQPLDILNLLGQLGDGLTLKGEHNTYVLLEYVIQATICDQLHAHLFKPFHPSIASDENRHSSNYNWSV